MDKRATGVQEGVVKVFGIGLQKTGTTTLGASLKTLGYSHQSYSHQAIADFRAGNHDALRAMVDKHDSFDDEPWAHAFRLLLLWYPDAKFVLTMRRSSEAWFETMCRHCRRIPHNPHREFFFGFDQPFDHKHEYIGVYEKHCREVQKRFEGKPDQLLVVCWENGDGWKELCDFLDKPVPQLPFPVANKRPPLNSKVIGSVVSKIRGLMNQLSRQASSRP